MIKLNGQLPDNYEPDLLKPLGERQTQRKNHKPGILLDSTGGTRHLLAGSRGREKSMLARATLPKNPITLGRTFSWDEPKEKSHETVQTKKGSSTASASD